MIMKLLVASSGLLEPGCIATELVDLNTGATLNVLDEFEMRPYSLSNFDVVRSFHKTLKYAHQISRIYIFFYSRITS